MPDDYRIRKIREAYEVANNFFTTGTEDIQSVGIKGVKAIINGLRRRMSPLGIELKSYKGWKQNEAVGRLWAIRDQLEALVNSGGEQ